METNRPSAPFGLSTRVRGRGELARLGLRPKAVLAQHGRARPWPRHAGTLGRDSVAATNGQRPSPVMSGRGVECTRTAMKRRTRWCLSREERRSESAGDRSASSAAPSMAVRAGTARLSPTYASKESLTPVRRRREGGGALCAGNRTAVACRRRNAAAEAMASGGERFSRSGSPKKRGRERASWGVEWRQSVGVVI
jgi:hypothetical protein